MKFTIDAQIEEVEAELKKRADVYGRLIRAGKMRASLAEFKIARMRAVLETLRWLRSHEDKIRKIYEAP